MTLKQKAARMRHAIDMIEGALMGCDDLVDLPALFDGADGHLIVAPRMTLSEVRRVCRALSLCTEIVNSDDFKL